MFHAEWLHDQDGLYPGSPWRQCSASTCGGKVTSIIALYIDLLVLLREVF